MPKGYYTKVKCSLGIHRWIQFIGQPRVEGGEIKFKNIEKRCIYCPVVKPALETLTLENHE